MSTETVTQTPMQLAIATVDQAAEMEALKKELAVAKAETLETRTLAQMSIGKNGLEATNTAQIWWLAGVYYRSGAAPKDDMIDKGVARPERDVRSRLFIKMSFGAELGMKPLQSLQNIAIINNRPCIWGDAAKALVLQSGLCEYCYDEEIGKQGTDGWGFACRTKRKGQAEETTTFTMIDAKRAGLASKPGDLYKLYPQRMLMFRARGFRLRDTYPDVLKGLVTAEEARDIDRERTPEVESVSFRELVGGDTESVAPQLASPNQEDSQPVSDIDAESQSVADQQEDESLTIAQWKEEVSGMSSLADLAKAKGNLPAISDDGKAALVAAIEMREASVRANRGQRSNQKTAFDADGGMGDRP